MEAVVTRPTEVNLTEIDATIGLERRVILLLRRQKELRYVSSTRIRRIFNIGRIYKLEKSIARLRQCIANEVLLL